MIYDHSSEMVPEQFFGFYIYFFFYNYKPVRNTLESVYNVPFVKYQ